MFHLCIAHLSQNKVPFAIEYPVGGDSDSIILSYA
jgi:hypothetical protein